MIFYTSLCRTFDITQDGKEADVAVKTCKVVEDEDTRKLESRAEKFLEEACKLKKKKNNNGVLHLNIFLFIMFKNLSNNFQKIGIFKSQVF